MKARRQSRTKKGVQDVMIDYFTQMFNASPDLDSEVINSVHLCVSTYMKDILQVPFQDEEFKRSIFQMDLNKSPCSNGLNLKSY